MDAIIAFINQYNGIALGVVLGLLLSWFWRFVFPIFQLKYKFFVNGIDGYVASKVQNVIVRQAVMHAILLAQKELSSAPAQERFLKAKEYIKKKCPDILDEAVDKILQTLYDEFVHANLVDNK